MGLIVYSAPVLAVQHLLTEEEEDVHFAEVHVNWGAVMDHVLIAI